VNVALRGLPRSWEPFVQGICAREKLPGFDRLWTDCIQEETRLESRMMDGRKRVAVMRTRPLQPALGRAEEVLLGEGFSREREHLQNQDRRRILVRSMF
jgi:hypothetical protein